MNILVVGRGWTGNKVFTELVKRDHTVTITSHKDAREVVSRGWYDWVFNCAGVTGFPNVDACEKNKTATILGNAAFPIELYSSCEEVGSRLLHFSSGCIYSGDIQDVDAEPNFFGSIYSISKGISDVYLKNKAVLCRIRMPFTGKNEPKNYLTKVYNYAKNAKLIDSGLNSLTDHDEAISVAIGLAEKDAPDGNYNLVNSGAITMHELADIMGISPQWFTPEEFKAATAAGRSTCTIPAYSEMSDVRVALKKAVANMGIIS